jgi:hypothetical protein
MTPSPADRTDPDNRKTFQIDTTSFILMCATMDAPVPAGYADGVALASE